MITPITPPVSIPGPSHLTEYRDRTAAGQRPLLANSTPTAPKSSTASNNGQFPEHQEKQRQRHAEAPPVKEPASMFAAAVIAGALPPTPKTMEELMQRIGISKIPEESEARLKDLLA